jgi:hypothetical protein
VLELCYYTLPVEMAHSVVEAGENFKVTEAHNPFSMIDWEKYAGGDIEVTDDQKKLIQAFIMLANQAAE